jgi:hypothetical protein
VGRRNKLLVGSLVVAVAAGGAAYATIPDSGGVFHACVSSLGTVRLIDPSTGAKCLKGETAVQWNQQGPRGLQGPQGIQGAQGPQGPAGPAGSIATLDSLEGIPCTGVNGKTATVHLSYGTGIEAPVQIICITHLVANPGAFGLTISGGEFQAFAGGFPIQSGSLTGGQIDFGGHITAAASKFTLSDIAFDWSQDFPGFTNVEVSGDASFVSLGVTGDLDPAAGTMSLTDSAYASVTFSAAAGGSTLYSGTCTLGTAASPIALTLSGSDYSQTTGAVTLTSHFNAPSLADCSPDPGIFEFVLGILAGSDTVTLNAATVPVIKAP